MHSESLLATLSMQNTFHKCDEEGSMDGEHVRFQERLVSIQRQLNASASAPRPSTDIYTRDIYKGQNWDTDIH